MSEADRRLAAVTEEALTQCSFEDIFTDSKFLKQGEGGGAVGNGNVADPLSLSPHPA